MNNIKAPIEYIVLICREVEKDSFMYKSAINTAQEIMSVLQIICGQSKIEKTERKEENSNIDEVKKYKELLDIGAITKEEFDKKKKELLNL